MDVQVALANEVETHRKTLCPGADASQRGLRRFLHDIAEFSRKGYATASFDEGGFNLQHFAADFSPGQSGGQTDFTIRRDTLLSKLDRAEHFANAFRIDHDARVFIRLFSDKLTRKLAAARSDLAFEIADAGLASVVTNNLQNAFVGKVELFHLQTVAFR